MSDILGKDEVRRLTGCAWASTQAAWLKARGIPHKLEGKRVIVQDGGNKPLADAIRSMYLRDTRKRAADLAGDAGEAAKLLQHSSQRLTENHYRTKPSKLRAVR